MVSWGRRRGQKSCHRGVGPTVGTRVALSGRARPSHSSVALSPGRGRGSRSRLPRARVNVSPGGFESFNGSARRRDRGGGGGRRVRGSQCSTHSSRAVEGSRELGAGWDGAQTPQEGGGGGGRGGAPGAATPSRPDGHFAVFVVSGKQMTEKKPSAGMGNVAGAEPAHIWVREGGKPLPRARGLPPPRMRQRRGFRGAGEGAAVQRTPQGKTKPPPTGLGTALRKLTLNKHANICK